VLLDLDPLGYRAAKELDTDRKLFLRTERDVISSENAGGMEQLLEHLDDDVAKGFEAGAHQLHDQPLVVPVADERGTTVTLAVNDAEGVRLFADRKASGRRGADAPAPPIVVEASRVVRVHQAEGDLRGGTPERDAKWLPTVIVDPGRPRGRGRPFDHVAAVNPWVSGRQTAGAFRRNAGDAGGIFLRAGHAGKVGRTGR